MNADRHTYLVTGAMGCIGAWVLNHLVRRGDRVVSFDLGNDRHRLDLLLSREEQESIIFETGDLRDSERLNTVVEAYNIDRVIHLAALQVPFCIADPILGAQVNVVGTVNVFEAARKFNIPHIAYASSVAVYGPPELYPEGVIADSPQSPQTLYGVYKAANEQTARIYWNDYEVSSTALRPYTVYGVGRDQGLTSDPTKAMLAAVRGEPFEIGYSSAMQFQYASDVARCFIEIADRPHAGAEVFNLGTPSASIADVVQIIQEIHPGADITFKQLELPYPADLDGSRLNAFLPDFEETELQEGIRQTMEHFEECG